jgi:hypothetical protein
MTRADELRALLARVEEADSPINELNRRLFALSWGWSFPLHGAALGEFEAIKREGLADFSGSTDAAYNLIDRELRSWSWEVRRSGFGLSEAAVWDPRRGSGARAEHMVPALALIAALLSALLAREEAEHGR